MLGTRKPITHAACFSGSASAEAEEQEVVSTRDECAPGDEHWLQGVCKHKQTDSRTGRGVQASPSDP